MKAADVKDYCKRHQCSMQEAKRVLGLEERIRALHTIHNRLGAVHSIEPIASAVRDLVNLLVADAEKELRR